MTLLKGHHSGKGDNPDLKNTGQLFFYAESIYEALSQICKDRHTDGRTSPKQYDPLFFFKIGGRNVMNMTNFLFPLTDITFQNHLSQQQGICGLVILTLWHTTAQELQIFQIFH